MSADLRFLTANRFPTTETRCCPEFSKNVLFQARMCCRIVKDSRNAPIPGPGEFAEAHSNLRNSKMRLAPLPGLVLNVLDQSGFRRGLKQTTFENRL